MSALAIYSIVTICNVAALSDCRPLLGFSDVHPGYTVEVCKRATADVVESWLKKNAPSYFIASVRCGFHEERGA